MRNFLIAIILLTLVTYSYSIFNISKLLASCTIGQFCVGNAFKPYNFYRLLEGDVAPYQVGFFRMNILDMVGTVDPYVNSMCSFYKVFSVLFSCLYRNKQI